MRRRATWTSVRRVATGVGPFVIAFVALLIVSAPRGLSSIVTAYSVPITTKAQEAALVFGGSDAGSMLTAALSWSDIHAITPGLHWVYNLWPPGMVVVDILVVNFEWATGVPAVLTMVILNCIVWAVFLGICFRVIRSLRGLPTAALFGVGAFLFTGVTSWGTNAGLFYSDSFGAMSLCFGFLFMVLAGIATTRRQRIVRWVLSGVFLGGACYFRASYEIVLLGVTVIALIAVVAAYLTSRIGRLPRFSTTTMRTFLPMLVASAVGQLVILPWRLYAGWRIHPGNFRWSAVSDLTSPLRWQSDSFLNANGASFLVNGHANFACINDPVQCEVINRLESSTASPWSMGPDGYFSAAELDRMAIESFFQHPLTYLGERFRALVIGMASDDGRTLKNFAIPETIVLVVLLVAIIVVVIRQRTLLQPANALFLGATVIQFATLALFHQESRYYLGIELSIILMAAIVLGRTPFRDREDSEIVRLGRTPKPREHRPQPVAAKSRRQPEEPPAE